MMVEKEDELFYFWEFKVKEVKIRGQIRLSMSYDHHDRTYEPHQKFSTCIINGYLFQPWIKHPYRP